MTDDTLDHDDTPYNWILVVFRGAAKDRAYKDPGELEIYGPYATPEEAEAWELLGVHERDFDSWRLPDVSTIIVGGLPDPYSAERFGDPDISDWDRWVDLGMDGTNEEPTDEQVAALNVVLPDWREELAKARDE